MKKIQNLKKIKQGQAELKIQMHKLFSQVKEDLENLKTKLPTPRIPKLIKENPEEEKPIRHEDEVVYQGIDEELQEIQGKLRELNS